MSDRPTHNLTARHANTRAENWTHVSADRHTDDHQDYAAKVSVSMTWEWAQMSPSALAMSQGKNLRASLCSPAASLSSYLDTA